MMLMELGPIATHKSKPTAKTLEAKMMLLNYAATNPDATMCFCASDMILYTHSDAFYLSEPMSRGRARAYLFLSDKKFIPVKLSAPSPLNGPIFIIPKMLRNVMSSAAEAEISAVFLIATGAFPILTTLHELVQNQPAMPIQEDKTTCSVFTNDTIKLN